MVQGREVEVVQEEANTSRSRCPNTMAISTEADTRGRIRWAQGGGGWRERERAALDGRKGVRVERERARARKLFLGNNVHNRRS